MILCMGVVFRHPCIALHFIEMLECMYTSIQVWKSMFRARTLDSVVVPMQLKVSEKEDCSGL